VERGGGKMSVKTEEIRVLKQLLANNHAYLQHFYKGLDLLESRIERLEDEMGLLRKEFELLKREVLSRVCTA
jgi:chaperonin cofactor prefoldin